MTNKPTLQDAFLKAQAEFKPARKDATNPHFKSKYATLKSVQDATYPSLHKHGVSVAFGVVWNPETQTPHGVKCQLVYGGESMETMVPCNFSGTPQQQMSAMTYAKRASLSLITGVVLDDESDDDGNAAEKAPVQRPKPTVKETMSAIGKAQDHERLDKIEVWVNEHCDTSLGRLMACIEKRRDEIDRKDVDATFDAGGKV